MINTMIRDLCFCRNRRKLRARVRKPSQKPKTKPEEHMSVRCGFLACFVRVILRPGALPGRGNTCITESVRGVAAARKASQFCVYETFLTQTHFFDLLACKMGFCMWAEEERQRPTPNFSSEKNHTLRGKGTNQMCGSRPRTEWFRQSLA